MKFDVVVVGAGSSGSVLATRLSANPDVSVALIEAGPDYPHEADLPERVRNLRHGPGGKWINEPQGVPSLPYDWNYVAEITDSRRAWVPRGRISGGCTSVNGSAFVRGTRDDFDSWAAAGNTEWSYAKVLPYLKRLETDLDFLNEFHGSDGPFFVSRLPRHEWAESDYLFESVTQELGFPSHEDHNHPDATGFGVIPRNSSDGNRMSTARVYLSQARDRKNLSVLANTRVHRVRFQASRAVAVEVAGDAGVELVEGDEIVLCGGAINTPHLLLTSGIGPSSQLRQHGIPIVMDLPGVGDSLRDHPVVELTWRPPEPSDGTPRPRDLGHTYLRFTAEGSDLSNDCRIKSPGSSAIEGLGDDEGGKRTVNVGLYLARSSGSITLHSADPYQQPRIRYNLVSDPSDKARMRSTVELALEMACSRDFRAFLGTLHQPADSDVASSHLLDAWIQRTVRSNHHPTSTARMAPDDDPYAVVDQELRVWGIDGLSIADASIMPDCVRHNTNNTCVMIGERAADLLQSRIGA